ncbi:thioredoxin family protein [Dyadobacter sp. CY356]|uniref:DUF1223 domain-containing protein n=1 Tax=Dyadobacter sp. CY356 TaxID=2906442 RepID=UPI001F39A0EA|nr:DUF1223 domain-containing protein [Dyadobacter sp. CY356]MCF0054630.1 DUF1223 domain-containing protein [Dyadobacter sp. CY356]
MKTPVKFFVATGLAIAAIIFSSFIQFKNKSEIKAVSTDPSNTKGFAVVELFTSQGCSSCPPAEDLVAKLENESAGKPVYILAFHVDYWNHQGWKDVFSDHDFTKRQYQYASWLKTESVYTPQIVVNGKREFIGSQEATLNDAISTSLNKSVAASLSLEATLNQNKIILQYLAKGAGANSDLQLALIQKLAQTTVKRGENAGRILSHVQIVRQIKSEAINSAGSGRAEILLPAGFDAKSWEVIGFIQNKNTGEILAANQPDLKLTI